jgi:hypothetical protein
VRNLFGEADRIAARASAVTRSCLLELEPTSRMVSRGGDAWVRKTASGAGYGPTVGQLKHACGRLSRGDADRPAVVVSLNSLPGQVSRDALPRPRGSSTSTVQRR